MVNGHTVCGIHVLRVCCLCIWTTPCVYVARMLCMKLMQHVRVCESTRVWCICGVCCVWCVLHVEGLQVACVVCRKGCVW